MNEAVLIGAVGSLAVFVAWLVKWNLARIDNQTKVNEGILNALTTISDNMKNHARDDKGFFEENTKVLKGLTRSTNKVCKAISQCSLKGGNGKVII